MPSRQDIRFCTASDGVRLAYATVGRGPPLVRAAHWLTHLEYDCESPIWSPFLDAIARRHAFVRYDQRGCGLSDRDPPDVSFEAYVRDLETVVNAAGLERFALLGISQGGAAAIAYAVRHPERVSHLILYGAFARGRLKRGGGPQAVEECLLYFKLAELGWGNEDPAFRQVFTSQFMPEGTREQFRAFDELQRRSASPRDAVRLMQAVAQIDVTDIAPQVACPTLVLHGRDDRRIPFEEGRLLSALIPGSRFVPLDSCNHVLFEREAAFNTFLQELEAFVREDAPGDAFPALTARERELLELLARGLDNHQIAAHLDLSEKTVRNHVSSVFTKLEVESRAQAIVRAREAGFGTPVPAVPAGKAAPDR
jgi:pimeloyl-ACP methyl ester carboxylesterase/DNA-binding CsgD family transcriptional regulator